MAETKSSMDIQIFSGALFNAVMQAAGPAWKVANAAEEWAEGERVCVKLTLEDGLNGEVLLELQQATAAMLAAKLLGKAAKKFGAAQTDALVKMIASAGQALAEALGERYGAFQVKASAMTAEAFENATVLHFAAADEVGESFAVRMSLGAGLAEMLRHRADAKDDAVVESETKPAVEHVNLDLVMDVELNVTLRFGQRLLTLREVLDLTSGSVIELDRQVEEPVELLLEGKVIARGEAVVIDGNYGLRVTDVPQPISRSMVA